MPTIKLNHETVMRLYREAKVKGPKFVEFWAETVADELMRGMDQSIRDLRQALNQQWETDRKVAEDVRLYGTGFTIHTRDGRRHVPVGAVKLDTEKLEPLETGPLEPEVRQ